MFSGSEEDDPIRTSLFPLSDISSPGFVNFPFQPIVESTGQDYFFSLTLDGPGMARVGSAAGNSYLSGAQYLSGEAQNSQTSFRLDYAPSLALFGVFEDILRWTALLIAGLFLVAVPGWAALSWLYPPWKSINWISKLGLAVGIGLALYPVLLLWTNTFGIQLGVINAYLLPVSGLLLIILRIFLDFRERGFSLRGIFSNSDDKEFRGAFQSKTMINWVSVLPDVVFLLVITII
ncbi:MAG: hypothetical protein KAT29_10275, partial [Anaerolineales bacterium]|nr:hypothetical protein [Anaerolineales bacterium]